MKEFDFDELDKAVNSLMGDVNKQTTPAAPDVSDATPVSVTPVSPTPEPSPVKPEDNAPVSSEPSPAPKTPDQPPIVSTPTPPPSSPTPSLARPSGRFMDVVHPSSDMKTAAPIVVPSREGVNLQPLTSINPPAGPKVMNDVIAPVVKRDDPQPPMPPQETTTLEPETIPSIETEPTDTGSSSEPWSSPFLPDTQVEKRPLGGVPDQNSTGLSAAIAAELAGENPSAEEPSPSAKVEAPEPEPTPSATPAVDVEPTTLAPNLKSETSSESPAMIDPKQDLQLAPEFDEKVVPAELDNDLVAIESGKASMAGETSEPVAAPDPTPPTSSALLSTSSIPQQYDETPSSGDASHTPIYDNEAVHQPLNHPAKKKKGWVLIVFIVIIVLLGGAVGGAAYYFGLI